MKISLLDNEDVFRLQEFMHDMELLFLDEPTVGLDPNARRNLLDYLKNKVKTGLTIFYTTHILSEAEYLCDKIAIIDKGKIVTVDTPDALKSKFGNEKTIKIHLNEEKKEKLSHFFQILKIVRLILIMGQILFIQKNLNMYYYKF